MKGLMLMLSSALILAVAGCSDPGPGSDPGGDPGVDAQEDVIQDDNGGGSDVVRDATDEVHDHGTPDTTDALVPPDADEDVSPDTAEVNSDIVADATDVISDTVEDTADATSDVPDASDASDATDVVGDTGVDTTEPPIFGPVFVGYSAAAGQSVSRGYSLGFTMGAGRFEFAAAGGDFILGPTMCVTE